MRYFRHAAGGALLLSLAAWSGCAPEAAPGAAVHPMGERVTTGSLVYNVFEAQWKAQLGDGAQARVPKDRFLLVRLSIANGGSAELMVPTLSIVDDSGQTYQELSDGESVPNWIGFLRHVKPAENLEGNIVFDVPPKHYRLRVADENGQKTADVDIPLNFGGDAPSIPPPSQ